MDYSRRGTGASSNRQSPAPRDLASPRYDSKTRITKPARPADSKASNSKAKYLTQDEQSRQWVADEDKFVLKQSKKKADIRVREGRATPIDHLTFNLRYIDPERDVFDDSDADIAIEVIHPISRIDNLALDQLTQLESDITSYLVLEENATNLRYWRALQTLCKDRIAKLDPRGHEGRVVSSVASDIDRILSPKTYAQLEALEKQIRAKLQSDEDIDADYWGQLLSSLLVWKAKATLNEIFDNITEQRNKELVARGSQGQDGSAQKTSRDASGGGNELVKKSDDLTSASATGNEDVSQATKALYDREAARGVSENEEIFTAEEAVPSGSKPQWTDKYRARKPRYFNRVQMGYEWNKYNQTHYDHDNPPPKVVQGYKFNIFYPELIDKTKAPTFKIIREHGRKRGESFAAAGEEDTCLIRFIAGPPYEDIAFRIVDREWDYSAKRERGFRSSFDKVREVFFSFLFPFLSL
ncbi:hypothetical protein S40285_01091 [Stachybotrys chlorohalonatus IBT 40285]|uniref:Splicing factor Cactin n=1 Tax=Stachybotrys chlorohalonatus (strain IBT 40285) TaxID=1283841 RepID=A0A084QKG4_STAC4|nr:hypothetical protein S40285_01091 [Stachybotrys chlorohalonata IBT 40285]